jgi:hypothetical protein
MKADPDWLLGRRFVADVRVSAISPREVVLALPDGDRVVLSRAEFDRAVSSGLFVESKEA